MKFLKSGRARKFGGLLTLQPTHYKSDDWVVSEVHEFSSPTSDMRIIVCFCEYSPIVSDWKAMKRGKPGIQIPG